MNQPEKPGDAPADQSAAAEALEHFVYDNPDLERLEAILDDFNPFVAVQWSKQELRHSAFLRWLLDPTETHGLGAYFLVVFWKRIARRGSGAGPGQPSVIDVDSWDMSAASVHTEWRQIDLLVQDDVNGFIGVIENKVDSREHDEQLARYRADVEHHFPAHRRLFVYLTPGGDAPSDDAYIPISYAEVVRLIEDMLERRGDQLGPDVGVFIRHYTEMVKRHIMEDSEIQHLCRTIYQKHRKALDMLFEYRPDRGSEVMHLLVDLIGRRPELIADHSSKAYIRFVPAGLDGLPRMGDGWTASKRMLLFEIDNYGQVGVRLVLGPGDSQVRDQIYRAIAAHPKTFNRAHQQLYPKWWSCHKEKWIGKQQYEELDLPELREELEKRLDRFLADELPPMLAALDELRREFATSAEGT